MLGSFEGRSRISASERPLDLTVCLYHDALRERVSQLEPKEGEGTHSRVRLRDDVATFRRHHNPLA